MTTQLLTIRTKGQGLYEITDAVLSAVNGARLNASGLVHLFIQHTSASLTIQENADPSARHDLEQWLCRPVPENDPNFTHTYEGADDMPAHIKAALTSTSLSIPLIEGRLGLGTWQGVYLWEHRRGNHERRVVVTIMAGR